MMGVSAMMADPATDFINKYELFVNGVAALDSGNVLPETADSIKRVYKALTVEYKGGGVFVRGRHSEHLPEWRE